MRSAVAGVRLKRTVCLVIVATLAVGSAAPAADPPPKAQRLDAAKVRIVLFCPNGVRPPVDYQSGLDRLADYTDAFILSGLKRWGHEPGVKSLFVRVDENGRPTDDGTGSVEVLGVIGEHGVDRYTKPDTHKEAVASAMRHFDLPAKGDLWWVLVYHGDPPTRFSDFRGGNSPQFGGWSIANYDSRLPRLRKTMPICAGLGDEMALKGMVHELGHAFGLPHIGPKAAPRRRHDNTLMGPNNFNYKRVAGRAVQNGHLSEASAAMLAVHPVVRGVPLSEWNLPTVKVADLALRPTATGNGFALAGTVRAVGAKPINAVLGDHPDSLPGEYWAKHYVAPVGDDGRFELPVTEAAESDGELRLWFTFPGGETTGNGRWRGANGAVKIPYRYADGRWTKAE
ncbi:hypothetical protein [Alienimonas chondri]|uniref:hypothetical protein n=1 Tax=Alienimonas chondri TaxID=2681879 RepID=UPI001487E275|nr:hypothetical protein [Alienimonas chondri]